MLKDGKSRKHNVEKQSSLKDEEKRHSDDEKSLVSGQPILPSLSPLDMALKAADPLVTELITSLLQRIKTLEESSLLNNTTKEKPYKKVSYASIATVDASTKIGAKIYRAKRVAI